MIKEIAGHSKIRFLANLWVVILALFIGFNIVSATGGQWQTVGKAGFSKGFIGQLSFSLNSKDIPYMVFADVGQSNKATTMKYNGSSWVNVGSAGFTPDSVDFVSLAFDSNDNPYVAFSSHKNNYEITVMKYNGSSWVNVGSAGFATSGAFISLVIDSNDNPYIAFNDYGNNGNLAVMKYNGSSWNNIGNLGSFRGLIYTKSFKLDSKNVPYIVFTDSLKNNKASVVSFNGSNWVNVGSAGFSVGIAHSLALGINSNDIPYVAFLDVANNTKPTVMEYNGSSWVNVGNAGFSTGSGSDMFITFDSNDNPYVSFIEYYNGYYISVMKFNGSSWVNVGNNNDKSLYHYAWLPFLAFDSNDVVYVGFGDASQGNKATVMKYNKMWSETGTTGGMNSTGGGTSIVNDLTSDHSRKFVAFSDDTVGNAATVLEYDEINDTWSPLPARGITPGRADGIDLEMKATSKYMALYMAFVDSANVDMWGNPKASVMEWDLSSWKPVGSLGFSLMGVEEIDMAIDMNNNPYVVIKDMATSYFATVMKYNGSNWVTVGRPGFSGAEVYYVSIAFDNLNMPWVTYVEQSTMLPAVMKWDGKAWIDVASSSLSSNKVDDTKIAFDSNNVPYVSFTEHDNSKWLVQDGKSTVMKFNGVSWIPVGQRRFSGPMANNVAYTTSLSIYKNQPYVSFSYGPDPGTNDGYTQQNGVSVMKYDGKAWVNVGQKSFSPDLTWWTDMTIDRWGVPYVSYVGETVNGSNVKVMKFD